MSRTATSKIDRPAEAASSARAACAFAALRQPRMTRSTSGREPSWRASSLPIPVLAPVIRTDRITASPSARSCSWRAAREDVEVTGDLMDYLSRGCENVTNKAKVLRSEIAVDPRARRRGVSVERLYLMLMLRKCVR